jgi:hypothetical protein
MWKPYRIALIIMIGLWPMIAIYGNDDDWGDMDPVEVIQPKKTPATFSNYWDEHLSGSISGLYSAGLNHSRMASEIKVGFNERWKNLKLVINTSHRQNIIHTKYEKYDEVYPTYEKKLVEEGYISLRNKRLEFRQLYVDFSPIQNVSIVAGKQTIVWGQLDVFSPVDFFLPLDFNPMGFSLIKNDNRMPQTAIRLSVYPHSNLELSGFYFPMFEESPLFKQLATSEENMTKIIPTGNDQASYAIRGIWYGKKLTFGATYFQGFNNIFPVFKDKYTGVKKEKYDSGFQKYFGYFPKKGVGLELSIPIGNISIKTEIAVSNGFTDIDTDNMPAAEIELLQKYNHGYSSIPEHETMTAIGIDADFDKWFANFYLIGLIFNKDPRMADFWKDYTEISGKNYKKRPNAFFPSLNIGRYLGNEKKGAYGFALGFFTGSLGGFLYVSNQINESWYWGSSFDIGFNWSDISAVINNTNNSSNTINTEYLFVEPKLTFGLGYKI